MNAIVGFFGFSSSLSYSAFSEALSKKDDDEKTCWVCLDPLTNEASVAHEGEGNKHPLHKRCLADLARSVATIPIPCGVCNRPTTPVEHVTESFPVLATSLVRGIALEVFGYSCFGNLH